MSHNLPLRDFKWLSEEELQNFSIDQVDARGATGFILEVTLRYPEKLHREHSSFPLAPEQLDISEDMLSPYAASCLKEITKKSKHRAKKLSATFNDRKNYICHGLNLKLYLELGMELVEIHRGISFVQSDFIRGYIDTCTKKRASAPTKSRSNMWKLLSNSLYGKMIESVAKRMQCRFVFGSASAKKSHSSPLFKGHARITDDFTISFLKKPRIRMNQSWAVGFSILELSKYIMFNMMYNIVKPRFPSGLSVLMSDTDSWIILVEAESADEVMKKLAPAADFSNYSASHPLFTSKRKNKVGYLKNECPSKEVTEFVGLRAKTYAIRVKSNNSKIEKISRLKGVKKVVRDRVPFEAMVECVETQKEYSVTQYSIVAKKHTNRLVKSKKIAFSSFDDKRYLMCSRHSVPYGSMFIKHFRRTGACFFCVNRTALC